MSRKLSSVSSSETPAPVNPEPILTGEQLATRLQVNSSTIYQLTRRRNKRPRPAMRVGKVLRFYFSEVDKMDARRRKAITSLINSEVFWWARLDSNQEPADYESDALTN